MTRRFSIGLTFLALGALAAASGCKSGEECQPGGTAQPWGKLTMKASEGGKPVGISYDCGYFENGTATFGFSADGLAADAQQVEIALPGSTISKGSFAVTPGGASLTVKGSPAFSSSTCALSNDGLITIGSVLLGPENTTTISGSFSIPQLCASASAELTSASGIFVLTQPTPTPAPTPN